MVHAVTKGTKNKAGIVFIPKLRSPHCTFCMGFLPLLRPNNLQIEVFSPTAIGDSLFLSIYLLIPKRLETRPKGK